MLLAAFLFLCQGCASGPRFSGPIQLASNAKIVIVDATARRKPHGILVSGDVRRSDSYHGAVTGQLHVVGRDGSGNVVAAADTPWGEFMSRRFRLAYFRVFLQTAAPSAIAIMSIEPVTQPTH